MPLFLFLIFPVVEIAGFILVGKAIGLLPTLALIVATSALGYTLLRDAGILTVLRLQRGIEAPGAILAEGGTRMLAGILLLLPGFITDLMGLALLMPGVGVRLARRFSARPPTRPGPDSEAPRVIEGEYRHIDD